MAILDIYTPFESAEGALQSCADSVLLFVAVRVPKSFQCIKELVYAYQEKKLKMKSGIRRKSQWEIKDKFKDILG